MKKFFALIDVDDTLLFDANTLNEPLIKALLAQGYTNVYLFTNMSLRDITHSVLTKDLKPINRQLSRAELIHALEKRGIHVNAVITPADPAYAKGLGAPYRDFYVPLAKRAFPELYPCDTHPSTPLDSKDCQKDPEYENKLREFEKLMAQTSEVNHANDRDINSKVPMFDYFVHEMRATCQPNDEITIVYADDKPYFLKGVMEAANRYRNDFKKFELHTVLVEPDSTEYQLSQLLPAQNTPRCSLSPFKKFLLITTAGIGTSLMLATGFGMISLGAIVLVASNGTLFVPFLAMVEKGILLIAASLGIGVGGLLVGGFATGAVLLGGSMFALNLNHQASKQGANHSPMISPSL